MTEHTFGDYSGDDDGPVAAPASTVFDLFKQEIQKDPDVPDHIDVPVRGRKGFKVRFATDMTLEKLEKWRKQATPNKRKPDDVDAQLLACLVIQGQCEGLVFNDELAKDPNGGVLDFNNPATLDSLQVYDAHAAIIKFYPNDSDLVAASNKISRACGYDLDGNEVDEDDDPLV